MIEELRKAYLIAFWGTAWIIFAVLGLATTVGGLGIAAAAVLNADAPLFLLGVGCLALSPVPWAIQHHIFKKFCP